MSVLHVTPFSPFWGVLFPQLRSSWWCSEHAGPRHVADARTLTFTCVPTRMSSFACNAICRPKLSVTCLSQSSVFRAERLRVARNLDHDMNFQCELEECLGLLFRVHFVTFRPVQKFRLGRRGGPQAACLHAGLSRAARYWYLGVCGCEKPRTISLRSLLTSPTGLMTRTLTRGKPLRTVSFSTSPVLGTGHVGIPRMSW